MVADPTAITALLPLKHFRPAFLREAMGSMFRQTSPAWRLVVIVEPEDLEAFRGHLAEWLGDERVSLVPNEGYRHAGAFNKGMRVATTDFIAILLGDDMWAPNAVERLRELIALHPDVDLFHSARRAIDSEGNPLSGAMLPVDPVTLDGFLWKSQVKHLICWRRAMGISVGGMDETLTTAGPDDYDFPWTMVEHGAVVKAIPEVLYLYRDHRDGFRNTTHHPRSVHLRDLRHILTKHGVSRANIRARVRRAKRGYLKQCLYRNRLHRWFCITTGWEPRAWWNTYTGESPEERTSA
jgi:glycosyltransferase involved in cell wall biosynthesis